ncbi:MAG: ABC transporter ATP-binding protein, partial [Solirubrobacterales bacterium]
MLFELEQVSYSRGGEPVLRGLDARLPAGASAVAGPSGSGKSTLLRLLNRLADPSPGRVLFEGEDVRARDVLALRRDVCLVPQLPALLEGTVADNVRFAAGCGGNGDEPDVARLLGLAGLDPGFAARDAGRLSVGEQQRAMLARSLALEPRVLLLDEPTS